MPFIFHEICKTSTPNMKILPIIGGQHLKTLDPFFMFNYSKFRLPEGFPAHPHRGFESITYMKQGTLYHEDFNGHKGCVGPGDARWMNVGRGIVHMEMPTSDKDYSVGFQLWKNIKSEDKMKQPQHLELKSNQFPTLITSTSSITQIAGNLLPNTPKTPLTSTSTPTLFLDIKIHPSQPPSQNFLTIPIKQNWNSLIFVYKGVIDYMVDGKEWRVTEGECCVLGKEGEEGEGKGKGEEGEVGHLFGSQTGGGFVLISGEPIGEDMCGDWRFLMNKEEEVQQAYEDYSQSKNGFEKSKTWHP